MENVDYIPGNRDPFSPVMINPFTGDTYIPNTISTISSNKDIKPQTKDNHSIYSYMESRNNTSIDCAMAYTTLDTLGIL